MADETVTTAAPETPAPPAIPPEVEERLKKLDAVERTNRDLLAEVKKLKGSNKDADAAAKTAEQLTHELKQQKAENEVLAAFNAEGIKLPPTLRKSYLSAVLNAPGVEQTDEGLTGVGDALKTLREAGLFGGIPEPAKPEASPAMAKPKANAAPIDPKFASITTRRALLALGVEAHAEFKSKYPERYETLR
jgi:hypothetical protein